MTIYWLIYLGGFSLVPLTFSSTCQHKSHESASQERVVDDVPEPLEMGEDVVNHWGAGLHHDANSGPELRYTHNSRPAL